MYYMRKHILLLAIFALHCFTMYAQQIKISGKVIDESNNPLPGVTISYVESGSGTLTNLEGDYSMRLCQEVSFNSVILATYPKQ